MTARFTLEPPLASTDTWVGRRRVQTRAVVNAIRDAEAEIETIWRENMARRDAAAAEYGEPDTPHEFYAGRPGSQAEKILCDCLRELRDIPETDRLYAKELTDAISAVYLDLAWAPPQQRDAVKIHRRTMALMRIGAEGEKSPRQMILFFDLISIIAAAIGIYYLLGTEWKRLDAYQRIDTVNACSLLAVIATLALVASFVGPFK